MDDSKGVHTNLIVIILIDWGVALTAAVREAETPYIVWKCAAHCMMLLVASESISGIILLRLRIGCPPQHHP
jgi:hypothetical protein